MSDVVLHIENNLATLTLSNTAKLNALDISMLDALDKQIAELEQNPLIRCIILTGAGDKAFCCGADINAWKNLSPIEFSRYWVRNGHRIFDRIARLAKPTIAALNGHAFGGGLELAGACDIRIMSPTATLALPEGLVGVVPGWSGTQRLLRLLPESVLKELVLFGRAIDANRALELGFVAEVSPEPLTTAKAWCGEALELSPIAGEISKNMIHAAAGEDTNAMIESLGSAAISATADRVEGVAAFYDKRKPVFKGD